MQQLVLIYCKTLLRHITFNAVIPRVTRYASVKWPTPNEELNDNFEDNKAKLSCFIKQ